MNSIHVEAGTVTTKNQPKRKEFITYNKICVLENVENEEAAQ
jgi:hypothetical protein